MLFMNNYCIGYHNIFLYKKKKIIKNRINIIYNQNDWYLTIETNIFDIESIINKKIKKKHLKK